MGQRGGVRRNCTHEWTGGRTGATSLIWPSRFIADNPEDEEAAVREFKQAVLHLNYLGGSSYIGASLGPREELEEWVRPKVEVWAHEVRTLHKISQQYPQLAYSGLGTSLQI